MAAERFDEDTKRNQGGTAKVISSLTVFARSGIFYVNNIFSKESENTMKYDFTAIEKKWQKKRTRKSESFMRC